MTLMISFFGTSKMDSELSENVSEIVPNKSERCTNLCECGMHCPQPAIEVLMLEHVETMEAQKNVSISGSQKVCFCSSWPGKTAFLKTCQVSFPDASRGVLVQELQKVQQLSLDGRPSELRIFVAAPSLHEFWNLTLYSGVPNQNVINTGWWMNREALEVERRISSELRQLFQHGTSTGSLSFFLVLILF